MTLVGRVQSFAERHGLWHPDSAVVAAVSGGSDSVALLLVLDELARTGRIGRLSVAHLHHHIRGDAADADAAFVEALAARLGRPCEVAHEDVPGLASATGHSIEVAGRQARLACFERLAAGPSAPVVALAHTRTDQAETVLLRLARGAGARGLAAMAPRTGHRVRPLLDESRDALRHWLGARGEGWREDASNEDLSIARNQVRHVVIPQLRRLNPGVEAALARTARIQAADGALLDQLAAIEAERLVQRDGVRVRLMLGETRRLPEALARRVVRLALLLVNPARTPGWTDTEALLQGSSSRLDLGTVRVELIGDLAVLSTRGPAPGQERALEVSVRLTLDVPGSVRHPSGWWEVTADGPSSPAEAGLQVPEGLARHRAPPGTGTAFDAAPTRVVVDAAALGRHLTIRGWQPGDRVQPLGLGGRKKLQDVFVDRKVPRDERRFVPVVVDADGRIVWVAGHVVAEPFRVTPRSEAVVVLTLR